MLFLILLLLFLVILLFLIMNMLLDACLRGPLAILIFLIIFVLILYYIVWVPLTVKRVFLVRIYRLMSLCVVALLLLGKLRCVLMRNKFSFVSEPHSFLSSIGERNHKLYEPRFDGSRVVLVESGSFDIQDRINSYAPFTDIAYMLNRLIVGDYSALSTRPPMYGDFSGMPDNPADAINLYHNAENAFSQLSTEEKLRFNNDFRVWLASIMGGNSSVSDSISDSQSAVAEPSVEPVTEPVRE